MRTITGQFNLETEFPATLSVVGVRVSIYKSAWIGSDFTSKYTEALISHSKDSLLG